MTTTQDTETASSSQDQTYLEMMKGMAIAQQARAMADLEADRCLLRRQMKAGQNETYGLGQESLPDCEDEMEVQVGDTTTDNSKVIHNHYHADPQPQPQPCPPTTKISRWLIAALVLPWVALAILLIGWILANWPDGGNSAQPVIWELDIGAENPEPQPAGELQ